MKAAAVALLLTIVFFGVLTTADAGGDITPPVLVAAAADRYQIDTSSSAQTITFTLHITDDLSGVKGVHVELSNEHGYNQARICQNWPTQLKRDITLDCAIAWPQYSAEGRWLVTWLALTDGVDNRTNGNVAQCSAFANGSCTHWEYTDAATDIVRSMVITIGTSDPGVDPSLYLPLMAR